MTKLLNDMADAGEQVEELLLELFNSLQAPMQTTWNPTFHNPHLQDSASHFDITINGKTYRPDPSEIRAVTPTHPNKGSSESSRALNDTAIPHPTGFLDNPLSRVADILQDAISTDEQVHIIRSTVSGQTSDLRLSQETLSALSALQLDELTRSRLGLIGKTSQDPGTGEEPPEDASSELQRPPQPDLKAILEEADHLERLLTRPSPYLLITLRDDNVTGRKSLDSLGRIVRLTKICRNTYLCKTLVNPTDTLSAVNQLDCVYWAGYYMKGFILARELTHAEPELRWWGFPRPCDLFTSTSTSTSTNATSPNDPIGLDRRYPLDGIIASRSITVHLVPHQDIDLIDLIPSIQRIVGIRNDHSSRFSSVLSGTSSSSSSSSSSSIRIKTTLEQLIELMDIDGLFGVYLAGECQLHGHDDEDDGDEDEDDQLDKTRSG
jgi:hypothetical protein